jgi:hypothetical protein
MPHSHPVTVDRITFTASVDKSNEQILKAALRYLLLQMRDKKEVPEGTTIDVTPWLEK